MREVQPWIAQEWEARGRSRAAPDTAQALIAQIAHERRSERLLEWTLAAPEALERALAHWRWTHTTPPLGALSVWTGAGEAAPAEDAEWAALEALERYTLTHEVKKARSAERTCESVRAMARAGAGPVQESVRRRAIRAVRCGHAFEGRVDAPGEVIGEALARADAAWRAALADTEETVTLVERAGRNALMWRIPMRGMTEAVAHSNTRFGPLRQAQRWQATYHEVAVPAQAKSGLGESRKAPLGRHEVNAVAQIARALEEEVRRETGWETEEGKPAEGGGKGGV